MKLKILLVPVLIVLIIIMAIWVVFPSLQDLNNKKVDLEKATFKLSDIQNKNDKADILSQSLNSNTDKLNTVLTYIPNQEKEEEIISNLNSLASSSGLSVFSMTVAPVEKTEEIVAVDASATGAPVDGTGVMPVEAAKPVISNFKVNLGVAGSYENIKNFLGKVASLRRFNIVAGLKISKNTTVKSEEQASSNNLQANVSFNFNYIVKNNSVMNIDDSVFSGSGFDMSVVDNIQSKMNTIVNGLTVGAIGMTNPFIK
jgi:Tfp pilus assembly protein PilO